MSPTPTEAVAAAYARMAEGQAEAWISVVPEDEALARARLLEEEGRGGRALWGVPFAVKDNIDVAGMTTTVACPAFAYVAEETAPAVQRLLDAGAVLVGKTNLDQFATGLVGTRSPYGTCHSVLDPALISGGSSSGSAVAVAEGVVGFALGTDTAGSGRVPAAANGIVGIKPSRGLVSTEGVVPACRSIDCVSVFARSVADAAAVLDVLSSPPVPNCVPKAAYGGSTDAISGQARPRLGVPHPGSWELSTAQAQAFTQAVTALGAFADVVEIDLSPLLDAGQLLYEGAFLAERLTTIGPLLASDPDAVHPVVRAVVEGGLGSTAADLFADQHRLADMHELMAALWTGDDAVDALVCPTVFDVPTIAAVEADPIGVNTALGRWTNGVNLLDLCGVTVPAGTRPDGLPGSVTVIGPAGTDAEVAAVAARVARPRVSLAVVGAHLQGLPLNHQLTDRAAYLEVSTRTAPVYRLHALDTVPPKPGMVRVADGGAAVAAEVWSLDVEAFGSFVAEVPPPLVVGTVELADGRLVKGFLCEPDVLDGAEDITPYGSWRAWLARP